MTDHNAPASLRWWAKTDKGRYRKNNEDAFLCLKLSGPEVFRLGHEGDGDLSGGDFIFAVSDGMGGANAGEFASQIAVDKITQLLPKSFKLTASGLHRGGDDFLQELFVRIHDQMMRMGQAYDETAGMGATLSLCWFTPEKAYFGHVGDSRIYHLPSGGGIYQITHDHTHVGWLMRKGELTEAQARQHKGRSMLQMALGGEIQVVEPQMGTVRYEAGDRFVFCSDGVSDCISTENVQDRATQTNPRNAHLTPAERLIDEAIFTSRDNMTAIVVEVQ